jgi:heme exporter protein CcmD
MSILFPWIAFGIACITLVLLAMHSRNSYRARRRIIQEQELRKEQMLERVFKDAVERRSTDVGQTGYSGRAYASRR